MLLLMARCYISVIFYDLKCILSLLEYLYLFSTELLIKNYVN